MKPYRRGVCIIVRAPRGSRVLLCHRIDSPPRRGWQFPQGGIHPKESVLQAAQRELREEIGTDRIVVRGVSTRSYSYIFPGSYKGKKKNRYRGQSLRWVMGRLLVSGMSAIRLDSARAEFDGYRWASPAEALEEIVDFKRDCYRKALRHFRLI